MKVIEIAIKLFGNLIATLQVPAGMDSDDMDLLVESKLDEHNVPEMYRKTDVEVDHKDVEIDDSPDLEPGDFWD